MTSRSVWRARILAVLLTVVAVFATTPSADAAVPDVKGWALWNDAAGSTVAFGTWPAATTVTPLMPAGRYQIKFPGQAAPGGGGVVHVTAINTNPHWCQAETWFPAGPDEIAIIRCYRLGGVIAPTNFSAFFTKSSGGPAAGPYGYVDSTAGGVLVSQYNSAGLGNTSTPGPVGQWTVSMPGVIAGGPLVGSWQATAVNSGVGAKCKVATWASTPNGQFARVWCFDSFGAPLNTRFTLTYQYRVSLYGAAFPPKYYGYFLNQPPAGPPPTNFNSVLGFGANTIMPAGLGLSLVTFPRIGFAQNTVQVTAFGANSDFCGLNTFWGNFGPGPDVVVRDVNCWTAGGAPVNSGFTVSANSIL
jgi:hypothetical protein